MREETRYYLINGYTVGLTCENGDFLYDDTNKRWYADIHHVIRDHLMGYDPYEPPGSPYAIFNQSIMDEIKEISEDEAKAIIDRKRGYLL